MDFEYQNLINKNKQKSKISSSGPPYMTQFEKYDPEVYHPLK